MYDLKILIPIESGRTSWSSPLLFARNKVGFSRVVVYVSALFRKTIFEPRHEISNNVVCATSKASDLPAHTCSLIKTIASRLSNQ